jgi:hypothetical protein
MTSALRGRRSLYAAALAVSGLLLFTDVTHADPRLDARTSSCKSLDDCLNVLHDWSRTYNGRIEDVTVAVTTLKRFGDPMRRALLDRATGKDRQLRQLSDLLLSAWHDWTLAMCGRSRVPFRPIRVEWSQERWVRSGRRRP